MNDEARIEAELAYAREARAAGKEGRARACARRAVGMALRQRLGWKGDALQVLKRLQAEAAAPEAVRAAARRLTTKVDRDHSLPFEEDPLDDARAMIDYAEQAARGATRA